MANIQLKTLPIGSLPYEDDKAATRMMVKLFETTPYLAMLPVANTNENIKYRTLSNLNGVLTKDKKYYLCSNMDKFRQISVKLDTIFNNPTAENLEPYKFDSYFFPKYLQILNRIKPKETVVNILGPFTMSQILINKSDIQILSDKMYRKFVIQSIAVKALWAIHQIKSASPDTTPLIILEEPLLHKIGNVKREYEDVTKDVIVNLFAKVIQKIKEYHGFVGIQCFEKCDWQIPLEAGVDVISFDAYNNPNNLTIIAEKINDFLVGGGRINWGIVPVPNEALVKSLTIDEVFNRFIKTIDNLIIAGTSERLTYNSAMVSINGNIDKLPSIFAEKALMLSTQLAKRIPFKS